MMSNRQRVLSVCFLLGLVLIQFVHGQAPCPVENNPIELAECAQVDVQAIINAATGDLKLFCNLAERYMECFKTKTRNCVGGWVAEGAFTELQNMAQWCCVKKGEPIPDECLLKRYPNCFSGDDFVSMANGEKKLVRHVKPGDRVLVMSEDKQVVEDEVIMMLDSQSSQAALFYSIETETGHRISLTSKHFLAVNHEKEFLPASEIKSNDVVYFNRQGRLETVRVRNVSTEVKLGYFSPMTNEGTLIVNDLAASCYSTVVSHRLAHYTLAPLRWWHRMAKFFAVEQPFAYEPDGGIHWIPKAMFDITGKILPSVLN